MFAENLQDMLSYYSAKIASIKKMTPGQQRHKKKRLERYLVVYLILKKFASRFMPKQKA